MVTETTQLSGPVALNLWPEPPAAIVTRTVLDDPVVLVLGSQEDYALRQLPEDRVSWWLAPNAYDSLFAQGNPLTYYRPNRHVTRHGNPYAPYFQVPVPELVAGTQESYILVPAPGRARTVMTTQGTVLGTTETFPATAPAPATPIPPDPVLGCPPIR
jgi:hypothetical protein